MPIPLPSGSIAEITFEGRQDGQTVMNVIHYYMEKAGGIDDARQSMNMLLAWVVGGPPAMLGKYLDCLTNQVDNIEVYGQWISPTRLTYQQAGGGPYTGAILLDGLPSNCQASITLRGDIADRHNLGRKAMPGVSIGAVLNSELTGAAKLVYQDFANTLLEVFVGPEGEEYKPVILNRVTPELSPVITEVFVQDTIRVERRRTVRVGA